MLKIKKLLNIQQFYSLVIIINLYYNNFLFKYINYYNLLIKLIKSGRLVRRKRLWKLYRSPKNLMFKFFKKYKYTFFTKKNISKGRVFSLQFNYKLRRSFMRWKRYNYKLKTKKLVFKIISKRSNKKVRFNFIKYINYSSINIKTQLLSNTTFSIHKRVLLNMYRVNQTLIRYFYKKTKYNLLKRFKPFKKFLSFATKGSRAGLLTYIFNKYKVANNKVIMLNYYKRLLWKIRKSRWTHWTLKKTGTLNKWRYKKLFYKDVSTYSSFKKFNELFVVFLLHTNRMSLSWRQAILMEKYQLFLVNGSYKFKSVDFNRGDIIEICYGRGLAIHAKVFSNFNKKIVFRLKRWSYRGHILRINKKPFKNVPKSIKSVGLGYKFMGKSIMVNRGIGVSTIIYKLNDNITNQLTNIYKTTILKLNNWRYRFN